MRLLGLLTVVSSLLLSGCLSTASSSERVSVGAPRVIAVPVHPGDVLVLKVPAGELAIVGGDGDELRATLSIECPADSKRCADWAADATLTTERRRGRVYAEVNAPIRVNANVLLEVEAPRDHPLQVEMGYGAIRAEGMRERVAVSLKAGDVALRMPREAVRAVNLAARFGDARMRVEGRHLAGRRPWLVGAKLDWREGEGAHDVDVHVRYGDVRLALYP